MYNPPQLILLPPHAVAYHWKEIKPLLEKAAQHGRGEVPVDEVLEQVLQFKMCVHVFEDAAGIRFATASRVTREDDGRKFLDVVFAAGIGGVDVLKKWFKEYEVTAKTMGASVVRCFCRPAIARYLRRHLPGSTSRQLEFYTVVEKEVTP